MTRRIFRFLFKCQDSEEKACFPTLKRKILCFCICSETKKYDIKTSTVDANTHSGTSSHTVNSSVKKMASSLKNTKNVQGNLWTHEDRMYAEKFFYLNKSSTKYAIVGLDTHTVKPVLRICDRATGRHISIIHTGLEPFIMVLANIVNCTYTLRRGLIENIDDQIACMKFECIGNGIWRISDGHTEYSNLQIHTSTIKNLLRIMELIRLHMGHYNTEAFGSMIEGLYSKLKPMKDTEIDSFLYEEFKKPTNGYMEHQALADLICYRDYFKR